jgi:hypothetical protein
MIAINQTIFGNGDDGTTPGNCVQAALASLLELPLTAVPHIALFDEFWKVALALWLKVRGKQMQVYTDDISAAWDWAQQGVSAFALDLAPSGQMMIATGQSFSGPWLHVVLWKSGELVHDTHPNRKGLDGSPTEFWHITDKAA